MNVSKSFDSVVNFRLGSKWEVVDPSNPNQCFDLAVGWCRDGLGLPTNIFAGLLYAQDIYKKPTSLSKSAFEFIANAPTAVTKVGDIVVWNGTYNGGVGHVAVAGHNANLSAFSAFSQNDPTFSTCILRTYNYNHVLGWLRLKGATYGDTPTALTVKSITGLLNEAVAAKRWE